MGETNKKESEVKKEYLNYEFHHYFLFKSEIKPAFY